MAKVKNKRTGEVREASVDELGSIALSGEYEIEAGAKVPVIVGGELRSLPIEALRDGADELGARPATAGEVAEVRKERQYGSGLAVGRAALEGGARGLTFGLSDVAQTGLGVDPEGLRERRARNPGVATASELAGAVAPVLLTGGAGAAAEGAGLATEGASLASQAASGLRMAGAVPRATTALATGAGRGVESGLAAILGEGRAAGAVSRATGAATTGAVEGGVYGAGQAVTEAALDDTDLTGERLLAHVKTGAVLGATVGGGLSAAVDAAAAGGAKLSELTGRALGKALSPEAIEREANKFAFAAGARGSRKGRMYEDAVRFGGKDGVERVGRDMLEEIPLATGKRFEQHTAADIAAGAEARKGVWGSRIEDALRNLDNAVETSQVALRPSAATIRQRIETEVIGPLTTKGAGATDQAIAQAIRGDVDPFFEQFASQGERALDEVGFTELQRFRVGFDRAKLASKPAPGQPSPRYEAMLKTRGIIEDELSKAVDTAGKAIGQDFGYAAAKQKWSSMKLAEDAAKNTLKSDGANRAFSLTDYLGGSAITAGSIAAFGLNPATLAVGLATGAVNKFFRTRGAAMTAGLGSRFAHTRALADAAQVVEGKTASAAKRFFESGAKTVKRAATFAAVNEERGSLRQRFDGRAKLVASLEVAPEAVISRAQRAVGDSAARVAPRTAIAFTAATGRAAQFLASKLPRPDVRGSDMLAHLDKRQRVPDSEMARFLRYADAVENPLGVIEAMGDGKVSREGAEALRVVYPSLFADLERQVMQHVVERDKPMGFQELMKLSILFDRPMHPAMEPAAIAQFQAVHAENREAQKKAAGVQMANASKMVGAQQTRSQQLEARA